MLYKYEAFNRNGIIITGEVDAASEASVVLYLEGKDLIPSKIRAETQKKKGLSLLNLQEIRLFESVKTTDVMFLVRNLGTSIRAGLSITEALQILINDAKPGMIKEILLKAKANVQAGRPLSETFAEYRKYFPPVFVGLIKAGEISSQLDKSLEGLSDHLMKEYSLIKKVKSAMVYPTLLLAASFAVIVFLLIFVLPRLARSFALSGTKLPLITKIVLGASNLLTSHYIIFISSLVFAGAALIYGKNTERGRLLTATILFRIPVVKDVIKKVALVRFTRTLGSLLAGASPVLDALRISGEAVGNRFYQKAITDIAEKVRSGVPLSKTMQTYNDLFPQLLVSLIAVGERTGNLEYVLGTFADFYDEEVQNRLKDLTTLFEPVMLIFMGLVVGGVAIAVLLPIYQLVGKFT